jgi:predicted transcriptional regulator
MAKAKLSKAERRILEQYWKLGRSSVREILESLPEDERIAYTTVRTLVYRLEQKGALRRVKIGNAQLFEAAIDQSEFRGGFGSRSARAVRGISPPAGLQSSRDRFAHAQGPKNATNGLAVPQRQPVEASAMHSARSSIKRTAVGSLLASTFLVKIRFMRLWMLPLAADSPCHSSEKPAGVSRPHFRISHRETTPLESMEANHA